MVDRRNGPQMNDRKPRYSPEELRARHLAKARSRRPAAAARKKVRYEAARELYKNRRKDGEPVQ